MKKLKIDIDNIANIMESSDRYDDLWYLDTDTGELVHIELSVMEDVEDGSTKAADESPEWMKKMVELAKIVLKDDRERFVEIPEFPSSESYDIMKQFVLDLKDKDIRNRLSDKIRGKGAFRHFKEAISEWPEIEKKWYIYREKSIRQEITDWLRSVGIKPENV
jgi:hypothetical protein